MNITKEIELQHLAAQNKMSLLPNYYFWPLSFIKIKKSDNIWDSSAGIGIMAEKLILDCNKLLITEFTEENLNILKDKFCNNPEITIQHCDLSNFDPSEYSKYNFSLILNLDVLEHIENDQLVLDSFYKVLPLGGKLLIKVPAHRFLFCEIDKQSLHYRRYSKNELIIKLQNAGFKVVKIRYINIMGAMTYLIKGRVLKKKTNFSNTFSKKKLKRFNKLIPVLIFIEKLFPVLWGLSIVAVAEKMEIS
jgi:ubiquinone/menaquinone biosynthesis C-methylase UbiE